MSPRVKPIGRLGLLTWKDTLPWQRDNDFILTSYRHASYSYLKSLASLFAIHNESANIWSHLLGAIFFAQVLYRYFEMGVNSGETKTQDIIALSVYNFSVTACFILSTIFHTFSDHSQEMHKFGNELDHLGIVLVMWGTGISGTYFAFYCDGFLRNTYFAILSSTALGCGIFTLRPEFRKPAYRTTRFLMYCFLGASLFAPVVHGLFRFGREELEHAMELWSFLGLALINFTGAAVYAMRIPERWFPGTFDLLGQSHNWMHVLVLTGAVVRLEGLLTVTARWQLYGLCPGTS
ncbi:HlyIII-domain-containing protein [Annulohypoxylon truncatum]|uniref:HlyIII-domain-containing protein n=1 Tax=Annulohypoxylon truncatum TaxID=327061 RepID=UPI0020081D12|nr:HlyIII-domain-containing protein [Annulohypoxylon truncatum]KAI1212955.1 HlyIII-domain-containing protein [Annulohypoxylon truncatum]